MKRSRICTYLFFMVAALGCMASEKEPGQRVLKGWLLADEIMVNPI